MADRCDLVIATIGRQSLAAAVWAGLLQVRADVRVVVIADGELAGATARDILLDCGALARVTLHVMPEKHGHGDVLKEWWSNNPDASPWLRFLDDDDWIPPYAIATMQEAAQPDTVLVMCHMTETRLKKGVCVDSYYRVSCLKPGLCGCGTMMVKTAALRGIAWERKPDSDYYVFAEVAKRGGMVHCGKCLYWYSGHRVWAKQDAGYVRVEL